MEDAQKKTQYGYKENAALVLQSERGRRDYSGAGDVQSIASKKTAAELMREMGSRARPDKDASKKSSKEKDKQTKSAARGNAQHTSRGGEARRAKGRTDVWLCLFSCLCCVRSDVPSTTTKTRVARSLARVWALDSVEPALLFCRLTWRVCIGLCRARHVQCTRRC